MEENPETKNLTVTIENTTTNRMETVELDMLVLSVGVEGDDGVVAVIDGVAESRTERRALALVGSLADDRGPGGLGVRRCIVRRSIVDDKHREMLTRFFDDRRDARTLVIGRDESENVRLACGQAGLTIGHQHPPGSDDQRSTPMARTVDPDISAHGTRTPRPPGG